MVAEQLRIVFYRPQIKVPRCVVASNYPDEGRSAGDGGDSCARLPFRADLARTEARAELRDRETYYTELRFAAHCQSRSIPQPQPAPDDQGPGLPAVGGQRSAGGESWDDLIARFGDTWT